jgi:hypothetical protein
MGNLLYLRKSENIVPTPICYKEGMCLIRYNVIDDSIPGLALGSFATVIAGQFKPFGVHALRMDDGEILATFYKSDARQVKVVPWHRDYAPFTCRRNELDTIGWCCEYFPTGLVEHRVVFWEPEMRALLLQGRYDLPIIRATMPP